MRLFVLCLTVCAVLPKPACAEEIEVAAAGMWHTRYISEGVDNLDGDALFSTEFNAAWKMLDAGVWYALSDTMDYCEFNAWIFAHQTVGWLDVHAGYTHLQFDLGFEQDHEYDHEVCFGAALNRFAVIPSVEYVYSTEAEGGLVTCALIYEKSGFDDRLTAAVEVAQLFDLGYVSSDYDGDNNTQIGVGAEVQLMPQMAVFVEGRYSWVGTNLRRDGLGDESVFGGGFVLGF